MYVCTVYYNVYNEIDDLQLILCIRICVELNCMYMCSSICTV